MPKTTLAALRAILPGRWTMRTLRHYRQKLIEKESRSLMNALKKTMDSKVFDKYLFNPLNKRLLGVTRTSLGLSRVDIQDVMFNDRTPGTVRWLFSGPYLRENMNRLRHYRSYGGTANGWHLATIYLHHSHRQYRTRFDAFFRVIHNNQKAVKEGQPNKQETIVFCVKAYDAPTWNRPPFARIHVSRWSEKKKPNINGQSFTTHEVCNNNAKQSGICIPMSHTTYQVNHMVYLSDIYDPMEKFAVRCTPPTSNLIPNSWCRGTVDVTGEFHIPVFVGKKRKIFYFDSD